MSEEVPPFTAVTRPLGTVQILVAVAAPTATVTARPGIPVPSLMPIPLRSGVSGPLVAVALVMAIARAGLVLGNTDVGVTIRPVVIATR